MSVDFRLLKELLHLPEEAAIIDVFIGNDDCSVDLIIEHPDLPEADDFMNIKRCRPVWQRQPEAVMIDWGVQE